ncbi:MAG: hypothetical protein IJJ33_05210 [Victivallales bacterium]|nr:hypothetical protein [Victivallales bacterium]
MSAIARWAVKERHLACTLTLIRETGRPEDGAAVSFRIPYQAMQYNQKIWTARRDYPRDIWEMGGQNIFYGDVCFGTVIPIATIYDPVANVGITVAKEPGRIGGRLSFRFEDYHGAGMYVEVSHLKVTSQPVRITLLFRGHEGCWRPGLAWYRDEFRAFFEPAIPDVYSCCSFAITNPFTDSRYLREYRPDWVEIHNHFPHYGEYVPEEDTWTSVIAHDYPNIAQERQLTVTRLMMHEHMAVLHDCHIRAMYYFQCGGDAWIPWAEKCFPEDIARDAGGHMIPSWHDCVLLNSCQDSSFGAYVKHKIKRLLDIYPEIDGVFADQTCYQTIDWAHQDGKTADNGREGCEFGLGIEENLRLLAETLHAVGKPILANGPFDMECALYADAVMSEGVSGNFDSQKYLCLNKPLLIHSYPTTPVIAEKIMRGCLLSGAGWSMGGSSTLVYPAWSAEVREVFLAYLPLVHAVFGAEILLTPDPVRAEPADMVKAEVFRSRQKKEYLLSVVFWHDTLVPKVALSVRLPMTCSRPEILKLGENAWRPLECLEKNGRLTMTLSGEIHCCVIRFPDGSSSVTSDGEMPGK